MRVKIKGFENGRSYIITSNQRNIPLDMDVFFSKNNYVLVNYFDRFTYEEKRYKSSKRIFKKFLQLPFPITIVEIDVNHFFVGYINKYQDLNQDHWSNLYSCENGCCTCCGCKCNESYPYDDEEEEG
jgi:hypothetical protein